MKKLINILSCLPVFLLIPVQMITQTNCNDLDFTISSTKITNSTCLSNGEIEVTISNATANISSLQYGLSSTSSSFTINPQPSNILHNIPPGTYEVTVRAFCKDDIDYSVVKTATNLVVGGTYKVTQASFSAGSSRKSYPGACGTGIITLNVTDGSGNFTFNIISAPAGVTTGLVNPAKNGTVYTLPGQNWQAGNYQIRVDDGCYSAMVNFTLEAMQGFPAFTNENYAGFRGDYNNTKNSCSYVGWSAYSSSLVSSNAVFNSDYLTYFNAGLYEIGMAPAGTDVSQVRNWTPWTVNTSTPLYVDLSSYGKQIKDFYSSSTANTITVFLRLKDCLTSYKSFTTYIITPSSSSIYVPYVYCDEVRTYPYTDYNAVLCYPLNLTITANDANNTLLYKKDGWVYDVDNATRIPTTYENYTITFTDRAGTSISRAISYNNYLYNAPYCNGYALYYRVYRSSIASGVNCPRWIGILIVTDPSNGSVICRDTVYNDNFHLSSKRLDYNKNYSVEILYPNGSSYSTTRNLAEPAPTVTLYVGNTSSYCSVNYGQLYVYTNPNVCWPTGTNFTITGPAGYTSQSYTVTTMSSSSYYNYFPLTDLPPGAYTITYNWGGGDCPKPVTFQNPGVYNFSKFTYFKEQTCSGLKIIPEGYMTYQGNATTTYFRLTDGPAGYDRSVISPGGSFTLSAPGTYTLGIMYSSSSTGCAISTQTIVYTAPPLSLDVNVTSAYVCVGETTGNISVSGINGTTPYKYELWNADNTIKEGVPDITTDGIAHFPHGLGNQSYTVRVSDACGNSFNQQVTLSDLATARIVYTPHHNDHVCDGETIEMKCITLGITEYHWTGPNGFTSNKQHPTIENANSSMNGWYYVEVMPEHCGTAVKDSILIQVYEPLTAGAVENQEICVWTDFVLNSRATTGGSGQYTYQWQSSENGTSGWTNIPGATGDTYSPPVQNKSGKFYYRKATIDETCGTVFSNASTVVIKACYAPVNPTIRSLP